jgi:poly-beta-1,6 N-acetyl-D-glucosamine synthase
MLRELSRRFYRVFFAVMCAASGLGLLTLVYFNFWFNRLQAVDQIVDFSGFLLIGFLLFLIVRYALLIVFAFLQHLERSHDPLQPHAYPHVTALVPAHNEGKLIAAAVEPLMAMDYPRYDVVVIDDGSTDDTYERAIELVPLYGAERLKVVTQPNGGKAVALNTGLASARGELVLCMDGDSVLEPQTIRQAVKHFADPDVGAVGGNVKVANRVNHLTRLQALEYIQGLNLVRTAHAFFRRVAVIPGPVGVFRKSVLEQVGGYLPDTFAEDCELTLRIMLAGWKIKYEPDAVAWTEAPESLAALFKQRYRWARGILQSMAKHKLRLLSPLPDPIDWLFLWLMVFETMIWPLMNVFALSFFICVAYWAGLSNLIVLWWAQLTVLDIVAALFCVAMEKEDLRLTLYAAFYNVFWVTYMDFAKFFASVDELLGVRMSWRKVERLGRI